MGAASESKGGPAKGCHAASRRHLTLTQTRGDRILLDVTKGILHEAPDTRVTKMARSKTGIETSLDAMEESGPGVTRLEVLQLCLPVLDKVLWH